MATAGDISKETLTQENTGQLNNGGPGALEAQPSPSTTASASLKPALVHRMRHDKSILAIAVSDTHIYAGTQGGEILVLCPEHQLRAMLIKIGIQPRDL